MKPLYLTDSYLIEWDAAVESVNGRHVTLEESAFYPAGGGQPCDFGKISCNGTSYNVVNVTKAGIEVDKEGLKAGDNVRCSIDWQRRYSLMRMHTAAHMLIAAICEEHSSSRSQRSNASLQMYNEGKVLVTGNQLDVEKSRIDFSMEDMNRQKIDECFEKVNEFVRQDIPVTFTFMQRDEVLKHKHLAKLAAGLPDIQEFRILKIGDVDEQADGGTHVMSTKEIGRIVLLSIENKGKLNRRVYYTVE